MNEPRSLVAGRSAVLTLHDIGLAGWNVVASPRLTDTTWTYELGDRPDVYWECPECEYPVLGTNDDVVTAIEAHPSPCGGGGNP